MDIFDLTALELGDLIKKRQISAPEAARAAFDRIDKLEATYGCYITLLKDEAFAQAEAVQRRIDAGEVRRLFWPKAPNFISRPWWAFLSGYTRSARCSAPKSIIPPAT